MCDSSIDYVVNDIFAGDICIPQEKQKRKLRKKKKRKKTMERNEPKAKKF